MRAFQAQTTLPKNANEPRNGKGELPVLNQPRKEKGELQFAHPFLAPTKLPPIRPPKAKSLNKPPKAVLQQPPAKGEGGDSTLQQKI